jgi:cobalt-precorrin 5A hydrolase
VERGAVTAQIESMSNAAGTFNAVAGFGFRADATLASLRSALQAAYAVNTNATQPVPRLAALATAEDKAMHPAIIELADELALPLLAVALAQLAPVTATASMTYSQHIPERYGARSVAESSALATAGPGAQLLAPRAVSADRMATAAIAIAPLNVNHSHTTPP